AAYRNPVLYPDSLVTTTAPESWRSQRYIRLQIEPFQVNPVTHELTIHSRVRVEIRFGLGVNAPAAQTGVNLSEGAFESVFQNGFLNYESGRSWRTPERAKPNLPRATSAASANHSFQLSVNADGMYKV